MVKGKIFLLPFPFDDLSALKVRPAVCLTDSIGKNRHVVVSFISSKISTGVLETDLMIESSHPDFIETGLRVSSVIRLHKLMTISTVLFQRELGALTPQMQEDIDRRIRKLFHL